MEIKKATLMALVLGITAAAILSWTLMAYRQPQPSESLTAMMQEMADYYGPGVGYEIHERTDNEAWASIYFEVENERIPFENLHFRKVNNEWEMAERRIWPVSSPSRDLDILGYEVRTSFVQLHEWSESHECLKWFAPVAKNSGHFPALIWEVEIRLENSTDCFRTSYRAGVLYVGLMSIGLVKPSETVEVGYSGGPAPSSRWLVDSISTYLQMQELEGKTFELTITLKDGEETVLAENTFIYTFA